MDDMKLMKKVIDTVRKAWPKMSQSARTYVKSTLAELDVDDPVVTDEESERV